MNRLTTKRFKRCYEFYIPQASPFQKLDFDQTFRQKRHLSLFPASCLILFHHEATYYHWFSWQHYILWSVAFMLSWVDPPGSFNLRLFPLGVLNKPVPWYNINIQKAHFIAQIGRIQVVYSNEQLFFIIISNVPIPYLQMIAKWFCHGLCKELLSYVGFVELASSDLFSSHSEYIRIYLFINLLFHLFVCFIYYPHFCK